MPTTKDASASAGCTGVTGFTTEHRARFSWAHRKDTTDDHTDSLSAAVAMAVCTKSGIHHHAR